MKCVDFLVIPEIYVDHKALFCPSFLESHLRYSSPATRSRATKIYLTLFMFNGSPLPSPLFPARTMPPLSIDKRTTEPSPARVDLHSFRTNSVENFLVEPEVANPVVRRSDRPDTNADAYSERWSFNDIESHGLPFNALPTFQQRPGRSSSGLSTERFGNITRPGTAGSDFPVVPTRPPLQPTISFGGVSTYSYYSTTASMLEQKSQAVAVEEEAEKDASLRAKVRTCLGSFCLR